MIVSVYIPPLMLIAPAGVLCVTIEAPAVVAQLLFIIFLRGADVIWFCLRALILLTVFVLICGTPVRAQTLQVSPVIIHLVPGEAATTLSVVNAGQSESTVQLRSFRWRQVDGADVLTKTDELEVSPPITDIPAGQTQVFRVVLRNPPSVTEASYRLLLDQLPSLREPGKVRLTLRMSLPVFAAAASIGAEEIIWQITTRDGLTVLTGKNPGTQHAHILYPVVKGQEHLSIVARPLNGPYILPGATQTWLIANQPSSASGRAWHLTAQSDAGRLDTTVAAVR